MEHIKGGVTAAKGFMAAGVEANVKYKNRKDMAMVYSQVPCKAAGVFTSNVVKAAPVVWDREKINTSPYIQAVVVNSGIANACTGRQGYAYCQETADAAAGARPSVFMPQAVMSQVAQLSMWGRKRSRASSASPVGRMCPSRMPCRLFSS